METKKLLLYGAIIYGVYYFLKKRRIAGAGPIGQRVERTQYWPQRTIYKPGIPE